MSLRLPIVKLAGGSSGGGSVTTIAKYSYVPPAFKYFEPVIKQLNMGIPILGAVLGTAIGIGAAPVVSCHFTVMSGDIGSLFNAGPAVVAGQYKRTALFERSPTVKEMLTRPLLSRSDM